MNRKRTAPLPTVLLLVGLLAPWGGGASAQTPPDSACVAPAAAPVLGQPAQRLARLAPGSAARLGHAGIVRADDLLGSLCAELPELGLAPAVMTVVGNSQWPTDGYDGALWAGRGMNASWTGGATARWGVFRITAAPVLTTEQNRTFRTEPAAFPGESAFAYPFSQNIDWPQRFGSGSLQALHGGESRASVELYGGSLGVSTENLWLGPALRYPLLLSNAAAGFPHLYLFSPRLHALFGEVELGAFLGRLEESRFFDADPSNDYRALSSFSMTVRPTATLSLGLATMRHHTLSGSWPSLGDYSAVGLPFTYVIGHDDNDNGLMSVFASWEDRSSGFEVHGEWGREDFFYDLADLVTDPTHSHAWTLGLSKGTATGSHRVLATLEVTQLSNYAQWYTNSDVTQGHTNEGQLLGAYVGTGADAEFASVDVLDGVGRRWSLELERVRRAEVWYQNTLNNRYSYRGHDVELRASVGHGRRVGPLVVEGAAGVNRRRNRNFIDIANWTFDWETNGQLQLTVSRLPRARREPS